MSYLVNCLTEKYDAAIISWQWLLGRLYIIERLVIDFPTEFLPRQRPDGASSDSSLEQTGAASSEEEEKPQNYDRLLVVAEFAILAVTNQHTRIGRVAKRVFLLAARYAAHLENLIKELINLLNALDFTHRKSLKRQLDKIVADFQLSEQLGRHLHGYDKELSPEDTPNRTPLSSPKCTSPVTVLSDSHSDGTMRQVTIREPDVPPNTPIKDRRRQSVEILLDEDCNDTLIINGTTLKMSKSLDDLDSIDAPKKVKRRKARKSKSPSGKSRSRSRTPNRIGPVLETDLDLVIKQEEEARKRLNSMSRTGDDSVFDDEGENGDLSAMLDVARAPPQSSAAFLSSPSSRLLSHDFETDIDTEEQDIDTLIRRTRGSCDDLLATGPCASYSQLETTPKMKLSKISKSLSLDLDGPKDSSKFLRSKLQCAQFLEPDRMPPLKNVSETSDPKQSAQTKSVHSPEKSKLKSPLKSMHVEKTDTKRKSRDCTNSTRRSSAEKFPTKKSYYRKSDSTDDLNDYMASTPMSGNEKPVTFKSEVAMATPKHSPSQTLDKGNKTHIMYAAFHNICH